MGEVTKFPDGISTSDLTVTDDLAVTDDVTIGGDLTVTGAITGSLTGTATGVVNTVTLASANGAISVKTGLVAITKAGVCALTLAAPTAGTDDGKVLTILATTAHAHTVTQATPGFNNAGSGGDVATFGGAIGDNAALVAYNGIWHTVSTRNVTLG